MQLPQVGNMLPTVKVSQFFDRPGVLRYLSKKEAKYLSRAGGTIRLTAKRSIRKRKGISKPGSPPSSHEGSLKRFLFYGLDKTNGSVVIGPSAIMRQSSGTEKRGASLLEFGGWTRRKKTRYDRKGQRYKVIERLHYKARPFMQPALEKIEPRLPQMFADA
jgi:hypothetical protein